MQCRTSYQSLPRPLLHLSLIALTVLGFALAAVPQVRAETATGSVTALRLNMRTGPSVGFPVITALNRYEVVTLVGRTANKQWLLVQRADGTSGWVGGEYISTKAQLTPLPVASDVVEYYAQIGTLPANIRAAPGLDAPVLFTLAEYTVLSISGKDSSGAWVKVRFNGAEGWANNAVFRFTYIPVRKLPVVE
jgi:uncharacterized protein YraI